MNTPEKKCEFCGDSFTPQNPRAKYCSDAHRNAAWKKANRGLAGPGTSTQQPQQQAMAIVAPQRQDITTPPGLDMHAKYIFDLQNKEIDRWEKLYNETRTDLKTITEDRNRIEKEFNQFKSTKELESIKSEKPSGLQGFAESGFGKQLMDFVGPALGELAMNAVRKAGQPQQQAGEDPTAQALLSLPQDVQNAFRDLINSILALQNPQVISAMIVRLKTLMTKGNVMNNGQHMPFNGTYGN